MCLEHMVPTAVYQSQLLFSFKTMCMLDLDQW